MFAELTITDGSTFVLDLLGANKGSGGIALTRYTPGRVNFKGGGIWHDSPLASGRRLVDGIRANVNDALELKIAYKSQNEIIQAQQNLDAIIEAIDDYWLTTWQAKTIYLVSRVAGETNKRYAVIYHMTLDSYPDPYHEPFTGRARQFVMDGLIVGLERSPWMDNPPQMGEAVLITPPNIADDETHAAVAAVPIAPRWSNNIGNITRYNGTTYASNLLANPFSAAYTIFYPDTLTTSHITYFGGGQPFSTLVFDIGTPMSATSWTIVWEYWNGSAWTTITAIDGDTHTYSVNDGTNKFQNTGVRLVSFVQPYNWATTAVNSVTLYWVRARISAISGTSVNPTQQNRHAYANIRPYVEIASTQVTGDLDALAKISCLLRAAPTSNAYRCNQVFAGLRTLSRGANFQAYVNVKTADNPIDVTVTLTTDTSIHATIPEYVTEPRATTGFLIKSVLASSEEIGEIFKVTFDQSVVDHYRGRFRLLARTLGSGMQLRYTVKVGATLAAISKTGEKKTLAGDTLAATAAIKFQVVDLGEIQIPPTDLLRADESFGDLHIIIEGGSPSGAGTLTVYINDLILLPADEWCAEVNANYLIAADVERTAEIDSIGNPKHNVRAMFRDTSPSAISIGCRTVTNQEAILHANTAQQLWLVLSEFNGQISKSNLELNGVISLEKNERYFNLRADS